MIPPLRNVRSAALSVIAAFSLAAAIEPSHAQTTATTDPVGFATIALPASSDSLVSIPFTRPVAFTGAVQTITGNNIAFSSPGFTSSYYVYAAGSQSNTYYAVVGPNIATVTGTVTVTNGSTAVTGSGFTPIAVGDEFTVNGLAYNVSAVASDTSLTLSRAYAGTSGSGLTATYDHSPKEGCYYTVTANDTGSVTVNLNGDSLSTVAAGTTVSLIPYWTLGTAFPASQAGTSFIASTSAKVRGTQILLPDLTDAGINLASTAIFYYLNGAWTIAGTATQGVVYNDTLLPPSTYFTVRNPATATTFTPIGGVYMNRLSIPLDAQASASQDNAVAVPRPSAVALNDLGLISSGAFAVSPSAKTRGDLLLTYDNTVTGINKAATAIYYYYSGAWRLVGAPNSSTDYGSTTIPYGVGMTIRKVANGTGNTNFWQNTRNY